MVNLLFVEQNILKKLNQKCPEERKKELYASGWEATAGRCKKYDFETKNGETIKVDGTWELKVAEYLDTINVVWYRNKQRFDYIKPNGKNSTYQPDFYVEDWGCFIEVKGYKTDLDLSKWNQFENKLLIWEKATVFALFNGRLIDWESTLFAKQLVS